VKVQLMKIVLKSVELHLFCNTQPFGQQLFYLLTTDAIPNLFRMAFYCFNAFY